MSEHQPGSQAPSLVRTCFTLPRQWQMLLEAANSGGRPLRSAVTVVDNPGWEDATHREVVERFGEFDMLLVADEVAMSAAEWPVLVLARDGEVFYGKRVPAGELGQGGPEDRDAKNH